MAGVKVTRELHAEVRKSLKTMGVVQAAARHGISRQTVRRIKLGGQHLAGYKRALEDDHVSFKGLFPKRTAEQDERFLHEKERPEPRISRWKPTFVDRAVARLKGLRG